MGPVQCWNLIGQHLEALKRYNIIQNGCVPYSGLISRGEIFEVFVDFKILTTKSFSHSPKETIMDLSVLSIVIILKNASTKKFLLSNPQNFPPSKVICYRVTCNFTTACCVYVPKST